MAAVVRDLGPASAPTGRGADGDGTVGELVCSPPVSTVTPGTFAPLRLDCRSDAAVDELVAAPEPLTAIEPGGFREVRWRPRRSPADVDDVVDDESEDVEPELDDELDDELVPESDGSADATAGVLTTAIPTPNATANAPTRPMYFALFIVVSPSIP
ncbi:MAG TPA: hypothetical protein VH496_18955 [Mycobacterium sp.]|jgi:hypothetical protein